MADYFSACTLRASVIHVEPLCKLPFVCSVDDLTLVCNVFSVFLFKLQLDYLFILLSSKFVFTAPASV